jgi:hypothetical protein
MVISLVFLTPHSLCIPLYLCTETFFDIPEPHRLSLCELQRLKHHSHNPGHLGILLTKRLFPELFRPDYLRREYSYFGAGKLNKTPRSAEKKTYLQRYLIVGYYKLRNVRWLMVDGRKCDLFIEASNVLCVINFVEHCTNI